MIGGTSLWFGWEFRNDRFEFGDLASFSGETLFETGDPDVGLVLGKRSSQQGSSGFGGVLLEQVDRHVVGRAERRTQTEAAAGGKSRNRLEAGEG